MARVQINYPAPEPVAAPVPAPAAPTYQPMPTKDQRFKLFGMIPFGQRGENTPLYREDDPAVRALYGLDDPSRGQQPAPAPAPTVLGAAEAPVRTPVSSYGVNDTGRTLPFAPVPTFANNTTLGAAKAPTWAGGGDAGASSGSISGVSTSTPFGGLLSMLFGGGQQSGGYEAALRERPEDIQRLVSMTRNPTQGQNAGGFFGGMFDKPKE